MLAVGRVISFDLVIWLVSTTILFALAPNPNRQNELHMGMSPGSPRFFESMHYLNLSVLAIDQCDGVLFFD